MTRNQASLERQTLMSATFFAFFLLLGSLFPLTDKAGNSWDPDGLTVQNETRVETGGMWDPNG